MVISWFVGQNPGEPVREASHPNSGSSGSHLGRAKGGLSRTDTMVWKLERSVCQEKPDPSRKTRELIKSSPNLGGRNAGVVLFGDEKEWPNLHLTSASKSKFSTCFEHTWHLKSGKSKIFIFFSPATVSQNL